MTLHPQQRAEMRVTPIHDLFASTYISVFRSMANVNKNIIHQSIRFIEKQNS